MRIPAVVCLTEEIPRIYLRPASVYCTATPTIVTTLLGSCVAVCLWDRRRSIAGMNHFLLPHDPSGCDTRYGDSAIDKLVAKMAVLGGDHRSMEAKVFGGAEVLAAGGPENSVGFKNVRMAIGRLEHYDIPVTAQRTGGKFGLRIRLNTQTGEVSVCTILP